MNLDSKKDAFRGFYDLGTNAVYLRGAAANTEFAVVRAGLNYKFGSTRTGRALRPRTEPGSPDDMRHGRRQTDRARSR